MRLIKEAKNNKERQDTYRYQLGRYKKAISNEFHFEAMIIVYAMIEDRLKSFLYYCGLFMNRNTLKLNEKIKTDIKEIVYGVGNSSKPLSFNKISSKVTVCVEILDWTVSVKSEEIRDKVYLKYLKHDIESLDIGGMKDVLEELSKNGTGWLSYRNEIIHASMNKIIEALYEDLSMNVEKGMEMARFIDGQVRILRNKGRVRKCLGLQNN